MELVVATNTSLSRAEIYDLELSELIYYIDYIQAQQVHEIEQKMDEYSTLLAIATAPHSKDGGKKLGKELEKIRLSLREIDETVTIEPSGADIEKIKAFAKRKGA